jgi:hypothetical protein
VTGRTEEEVCDQVLSECLDEGAVGILDSRGGRQSEGGGTMVVALTMMIATAFYVELGLGVVRGPASTRIPGV